jgi:hypothetical protein
MKKRCEADCSDFPCNCHNDKVSGVMAFDDLSMITRIVSSVKIATAFREQNSAVAFVGAKDRHSRENTETVTHKFRCGLDTAQ